MELIWPTALALLSVNFREIKMLIDVILQPEVVLILASQHRTRRSQPGSMATYQPMNFTMVLPSPVFFDKSKHFGLLGQICQIHKACILSDHQILAFLPGPDGDISNRRLEEFWKSQMVCRNGTSRKEIILQLDADNTRLLGFVILDMPFAETGPFRAFVQKLSEYTRLNGAITKCH